jgi:predicted nucleic acid-binding protein
MKPTRFVADASVAIAWAHPGQATASTQAMLEAIAAGAVFEVPSLWLLEVANALFVLRRRGHITERERRLTAERLLMLPHVVDGDGVSLAFTRLTDLAAKYGLSIYDAAYLELAVPLCANDR